ncbi:transmembrane channel-like protein 7 isoform X1 [Patella vulgata]|uniref:transmembrane channel-like protein 7 isoform X1 n=1 Tax=Patella vulgata TaxID=6465 RepID=UPI0024A9FEC8|nr:transmembrane channel-like protein 7 isoform X1 [Patella vulgata]
MSNYPRSRSRMDYTYNQWDDIPPDYEDRTTTETNNEQYLNQVADLNRYNIARGLSLDPSPNVYSNKRKFKADKLISSNNNSQHMEPYRSPGQPINEYNNERGVSPVRGIERSTSYRPEDNSYKLDNIQGPSYPRENQHYPQQSFKDTRSTPRTNYHPTTNNARGEVNPAFESDTLPPDYEDAYIPTHRNSFPRNSENQMLTNRKHRHSGLYRKHRGDSTNMEDDRISNGTVDLNNYKNMMGVLATIRIKRKARKSLKTIRLKREDQGYIETDDETELEEERGLPSTKRQHPKTLREKLQAKESSTQELADGLRDLEDEPGFKSLKQKFKQAWQRKKADLKGYLYQLELWASTFKEIEGKFGTATASYFRFTRWLMFLNVYIFLITLPVIVLPTLFSENDDFASDFNVTNTTHIGVIEAINCSRYYDRHIENIKNTDSTTDKVLNFFKGTGWMEKTHLFYGLYHNLTFTESVTDASRQFDFNIGLGYLLAIGITFLISFILIVKNSGKSVKEGVIDAEDSNTMYCNKVFSAWDFCIFNEKAASIKHANVCYEFKADLEEQRLRLRQADRSAREKCRLYTIRFFINIFVVVVLGACLYLIYWTSDKLLDLQKQNLDDDVLRLIVEFLPSLTITFLNVVIPLMFSKIVLPEDYSPVFELKITLFRTVLLRLASLGVLVFSLYYQLLSTDEARCTESCCGNQQWTLTDSDGSIKCWETYIGQQFYKLALLDFAVVLIVTFLYEFPRTLIYTKYKDKKIIELIGEQEFDLPKNVLDIVYSQTLCWLGMFFCPLIPLITMLKCFIVFYVKKLSLIKNCVPTKRPYKASRSNSFFMTVLLISFILAAVPLGYMLGNIPPSQSCGPFRVYSKRSDYYMFDVIRDEIATWPPIAETIFSFMGTVGFFIPAMILLCLVMYGYWAAAQGYQKKQELLKDQLKLEGKDRQYLLARVNDVIKKGGLSRQNTSRNL